MLNVSTAWRNAAKDQFRFPAYLTCYIDIVPPGIREGAIVTTDDSAPMSIVSKIKDGVQYPSVEYETMEPNRTVLDGTCDVLQDGTVTDVWWSDQAQPTSILFVFDALYSVPGVYMVFDNINKGYPRSMTVVGLDAAGLVKYTTTVTDISSPFGFFKIPMDDIKSVRLDFPAVATPGWRTRIAEITFGFATSFTSYHAGRVNSARMLDTASPIGLDLPVHSLSVTLRNLDQYFDPQLKSGVSKYLVERQLVKAVWAFETSKGVVEEAPAIKYYTSKISVPSDSMNVNMELTSILAFLDTQFLRGPGEVVTRTLAEYAQQVFENSGILKQSDEETPWIIDPAFSLLETNAPFLAVNTNALLLYVAQAGGGWLTVDTNTGYAHVMKESSDMLDVVDKTTGWGDPGITTQTEVKQVKVDIYTYSPASTRTTVGTFSAALDEKTVIEVSFGDDIVSGATATISGGTINESVFYANQAVLAVTPTSPGGTVTVTVSGYVVAQTSTTVTTYDNLNLAHGSVLAITNPIVTNMDLAQLITSQVLKYARVETEYSQSYQGFVHLEAGDGVTYTSRYGVLDTHVVSNEVNFNGGWSGKVVLQ